MQRRFLAALSLLTLVALPLAAAQDGQDAQEETDINVDAPDDVDVDVDDNDAGGADESTFAGMSTTVVIILIVLAVLVVALIVAMASRP